MLAAILYSFTVIFLGTCDGTDQVYKWILGGSIASNSSFLRPWTDKQIFIRGIELTKISGGPTIWFMAGNDTVADAMAFMGPGESHTRHDFPDRTGQPFPATIDAKGTDYLDLHGACSGGDPVKIFYTVYYTELTSQR